MKWASLHTHTHYSLEDAISKPAKIAARAADQGYPAMAMTDAGNIGCSVDFVKAMTKRGIKPILGCQFNICKLDPSIKDGSNTPPYPKATVLAKNLNGWRQLVSAVSAANHPDSYYKEPRLSLDRMMTFAGKGDLIALSGQPGTELANAIFTDLRGAYSCSTYAELKDKFLLEQGKCRRRLVKIAERYIATFGRGNVFIEVMQMDDDTLPALRAIAVANRWLGRRMKIPCVAVADPHYVSPSDADAMDHRVILCSRMKTAMRNGLAKAGEHPDPLLRNFFMSNKRHIPGIDELRRLYAGHEEEIAATLEIADMCEQYDILRAPMVPSFPCSRNLSAAEYLTQLCEQGWRSKIEGRVLPRPLDEYQARLEMELKVLNEAGLADYFLIVQDYMNWSRGQGWLVGCARGSAGGCLVSYLTGITAIDPLQYGLMFERFYNAGRNSPGRISLPDIDSDFPINKRELVFNYLQEKYGQYKVARIATFNSLKGRGALTEVFRAREVNYELAKQITRVIPEPSRITEELQSIRDAYTDEEKASGKEPSIIEYTLDTFGDDLADWVHVEDDGKLAGDLAPHFMQAIRLEGVKKHISTHAAGVVLSSESLGSLCPLGWDNSSKAFRADMEYPALESMGLVKLDLLGVAALDKGECVRQLCLTGELDD
jgi:DNA polymerase-3 subunit alpha